MQLPQPAPGEPVQERAWTSDRDRCQAAKIPDEREFRTKLELVKAMVLRASS